MVKVLPEEGYEKIRIVECVETVETGYSIPFNNKNIGQNNDIRRGADHKRRNELVNTVGSVNNSYKCHRTMNDTTVVLAVVVLYIGWNPGLCSNCAISIN